MGNPSVARILDEQGAEFPLGALGLFQTPVVSVAVEYQAELRAIQDWKARRANVMQLVGRLEALERKQLETVAVKA